MYTYEIYNYGSIESIDRQIEELQRRKEALQNGYCYIPNHTPVLNNYRLGRLENDFTSGELEA